MKKWRQGLRTHWPKIALVFIVLALMVWASYAYVGAIMRDQLRATASQSLLTVEANIRAGLEMPKAILVAASVSLHSRLMESRPAVHTYMKRFSRWLQENEQYVTGFNDIYGWIDDEYVDGRGWVPPDGYAPVERPWYLAGKAGGGRIAVTDVYIDADTNQPIVSYVQELFDDSHVSRGVVGIDMSLKAITDYVTSMQLSASGYSMLLSNDGTILAHSDESRVGTPLRIEFASLTKNLPDGDDISGQRVTDKPMRILEKTLLDGGDISELRVINPLDKNGVFVVFVKRLSNDWYVCTIVPERIYYGKLWAMAQGLALMGLGFALILSVILLRLSLAQINADEANHIKTLFLARMSHEIRTPMNAIIGMSDLILHEIISPAVRAYTADVKQAGLNLLALINDILDFSRIESGKMELHETEYDLSSLIHDLVSIIKMRVAEKPVNFAVFVDSGLPVALIGDVARIRQVLLNLLTNAVKYTQKGEIVLSIRILEIRGNDEIDIVCNVQDSGIGIKPEDFGKLFSDFTRIDTKANIGVEGTGLGLTIARNLALMMGGDITVRSKYGEGSVFTAIFRQKFKTQVCFAQVENARGKIVLVYEPQRKASATWLIKTLGNLGVRADWVSTPEAFERALSERHYDFVFSGLFLVKEVMSLLVRHGLDTVPVVVLSAKTGELIPPGVRVLIQPAYSASVAKVLNGEMDENYFAAPASNARFILPDVKALVVDDIEVNLRVIKGLLSHYKVQVDCALSGEEAIRLARMNHYDIIFMDHMMPQMDGIEATAKLRAMNGEFKTLPIVALTANAVHGMREIFLSCGFSDFLSKPIDPGKLNDILDRWIPASRRRESAPEADIPAGAETSPAFIVPIAGVDVNLGLSRVGGRAEFYLEILTVFVREAEDRLEKLDPSADLKLFTIHIHALKSAAANIGATDVSAAAAALEAAGDADDRAAVINRWDDFVFSLKALNENIHAALQKVREAATITKPVIQTAEEAREILTHLKTAIHSLDIDGADAALERLQHVPLDSHWRERTTAIANMILLARFDEAMATIGSLESTSPAQRRGV